MKIFEWIFCFFLVFFYPFNFVFAQKQTFELRGTIDSQYTGKIFLYFDDDLGNKDSSDVIGGKFYFKGKATTPILTRLYLTDDSNVTEFYLEKGRTDMKCSIHSWISNGASVNSIAIEPYTNDKTQKLRNDLKKSLFLINSSNGEKEDKSNRYYKTFAEFIVKFPKSKAGVNVLGSYMNELTYTQAKTLFEMFDSSLLNTCEIGLVGNNLAQMKNRMLTKEGTPFHDFVSADTSGNIVDTKTFKGRYILIECWASWCGPCRKEHPKLNEIYRKYKADDLVIVGFSLDKLKDRDKWKKAIVADKINWLQVSNLDGGESGLPKDYEVSFIPYYFLIDRAGKIVGAKLYLDGIDELLEKLLH